jgi:hypothetical protein
LGIVLYIGDICWNLLSKFGDFRFFSPSIWQHWVHFLSFSSGSQWEPITFPICSPCSRYVPHHVPSSISFLCHMLWQMLSSSHLYRLGGRNGLHTNIKLLLLWVVVHVYSLMRINFFNFISLPLDSGIETSLPGTVQTFDFSKGFSPLRPINQFIIIY